MSVITNRMVLSLLTFTCMLLCSFSPQAELQARHERGTVTLPMPPQRVVALEYSFVDALASVGVSPVGIADDLDAKRVLPAVRELIGPWTSVGIRSQPSLEAISELKPDLIIADLYRHQVSYEDLSKIAPTMLLKSRGETYQDSLDSALLIGIAVGKEEKMRARLQQHKAFIEAYRGKFKNIGRVQFANVNDRGMWMHGPLSYTGSLLAHLGLKPAFPDLKENHLMQVNLELLLKVNPDWLFYGKKEPLTVLDSWQKNPLFKLLNIDKTKQMRQVSSQLWSLNRGMLAAEGIVKELDQILSEKE